MVKIVSFKTSHRAAVLEFFKDVPFKEILWDWQFEATTDSNFKKAGLIVAEDEQGVAGFNGVMPVSVTYEGEDISAAWSCDFHVDARARGRGIGQAIKKELLCSCPAVMSFGVSDQAKIVLGKMGWSLCSEVRTFRRIVRPKSAREWVFVLFQKLNYLCTRVESKISGFAVVQDQLPDSSEINALWQWSKKGYSKAVNRTYSYLDWRYQRHPMANYQFLVCREWSGSLRGILVVRKHGDLLRIIDYIGGATDTELMGMMLRELEKVFSDSRISMVTTSNSSLIKVLKSFGFAAIRSNPALFVRVPETNTESSVGWFVMTGDSDGEILRAAWDNWSTWPEKVKIGKGKSE